MRKLQAMTSMTGLFAGTPAFAHPQETAPAQLWAHVLSNPDHLAALLVALAASLALWRAIQTRRQTPQHCRRRH